MRNSYKIMGNVAIIKLGRKQGKPLHAVIDKADLPKLKAINVNWNAMEDYTVKKEKKYYVVATHEGKSILLHRQLIECPKDHVIDHRNGNGLNNRRSNLRILNRSQNAINRRGAEKRSKSGVLGVSWRKRSGKWRARVKVHGKSFYEREFVNIEDAERAVKQARIEAFNSLY